MDKGRSVLGHITSGGRTGKTSSRTLLP